MQLIIHATSAGLYPNVYETPDFDTDTLLPHMVVAVGIHNSLMMRLLCVALQRGCHVADRLGMLVSKA